MNRADLKVLADDRVADAIVLIAAGRWSASYYLLGYVVECALKACVAGQFRQEEVPDKQIVLDFYTHKLEKLLSISGLKTAFDAHSKADPVFARNWNSVCDWNESTRYDHAIPEVKAQNMLTAVTDPTSGVLPWLKSQW